MKILYLSLYMIIATPSLHAALITLNQWKKGKQTVVVLGDQTIHATERNNNNNIECEEDEKQSKLFFEYLDTINAKNNKTALLLDASNDFNEQSESLLAQANQNPKKYYVGMHLKLLQLPQKNNYTSLVPIGCDLRNAAVNRPIQCIEKLLARDTTSHQIVTVQNYLQSLKNLQQLTSDTPEYNEISTHINRAKEFFTSDTPEYNSYTVDSVIQSHVFQKGKKHSSVNECLETFLQENKWIQDLSKLIGTVGIRKALRTSIKQYDSIIVYAGQHLAIDANEELNKLGYTLKIKYGIQIKSPNLLTRFAPLSYLENVLGEFISKKTCSHCQEPAETQCSQCKANYYCSIGCQKQDWPKHKATCKPKAMTRSKTKK